MSGLTQSQIEFYTEQGYLLVDDVIPTHDFDLLISELNSQVDKNARQAFEAGSLEDLLEDEPFERRLARLVETMPDSWNTSSSDPMFDGMKGKLKTPGMFQILRHPGILDIVESLIGPDILAHPQFNIRAKLPRQDAAVVPWHQDLGYLEPDADETFMVNFWIPLVDATEENGCLEVIAGSHRENLIPHTPGLGPAGNFKGLTDDLLPPGDQVMCPVKLGGVLLLLHKTIHRSIPNLSDHARWSLDLRYSDPKMPTGRDEVPGFIARSKSDPASVTESLEDWLSLVGEVNS